MSKNYCLGFAFKETPSGLKVVLIEKTKPDWQRGKLNGVGGKIEDGEYCNVAMGREFEEETGCATFCTQWEKFTEMHFKDDVVVYCFAAKLLSHQEVRTITEERVLVFDVRDYPHDSRLIPNLLWLIPMARFALKNEGKEFLPEYLFS